MQFFLKGQEYLCVLAHRGLRPSPSCPSLIALPGGGGQAHRAAPSLRPLVLMVSAKRSLRLHVGVQEAPALTSGSHVELITQCCVPGCPSMCIPLGLGPPHPSLPVGRGACDTKQGSAALQLGLQNSTPWEPSPQVFVSLLAHMTVD